MLKELRHGERVKISEFCSSSFQISLNINTQKASFDTLVFGLDAGKKLSDDRYMVFFNQPKTPCGAIEQKNANTFAFDVSKLPPSIDNIVVALSVDETASSGLTVKDLLSSSISLKDNNDFEKAIFRFDGHLFNQEKAIMLFEVYKKDGEWRLSAIGQGFNQGLSALVEYFGGEVKKEAPIVQKPDPIPAKPLSLSKITLDKKGESISLKKKSEGYGRVICNLNWSRGQIEPAKQGFFSKVFSDISQGSKVDLDLACLFELKDGHKGCIQALGSKFGSYDREPYIHLAGDDRTGQNKDGEFLFINGNQWHQIKRICVFSSIYSGVPDWAKTDGIVTVNLEGHPPIEIRLDNGDSRKSACAIAMIENKADTIELTKLGEYFEGVMDIDQKYGWGLRWTYGSK